MNSTALRVYNLLLDEYPEHPDLIREVMARWSGELIDDVKTFARSLSREVAVEIDRTNEEVKLARRVLRAAEAALDGRKVGYLKVRRLEDGTLVLLPADAPE